MLKLNQLKPLLHMAFDDVPAFPSNFKKAFGVPVSSNALSYLVQLGICGLRFVYGVGFNSFHLYL